MSLQGHFRQPPQTADISHLPHTVQPMQGCTRTPQTAALFAAVLRSLPLGTSTRSPRLSAVDHMGPSSPLGVLAPLGGTERVTVFYPAGRIGMAGLRRADRVTLLP